MLGQAAPDEEYLEKEARARLKREGAMSHRRVLSARVVEGLEEGAHGVETAHWCWCRAS